MQGDSNLHLNVSSPDPAVESIIEPFVWEYVKTYRGSISAEHGVGSSLSLYFASFFFFFSHPSSEGLQKVDKMGYSKSSAAMSLIKGVKLQLDPNLILNPYKIAPDVKWD